MKDNKDDVEDEPEVHLLDADVVAEEVDFHHGHEPSKITSEENIKDNLQIQGSIDSRPCEKWILRSEV